MKNVTTFLLALAALSLSACGGGGGSSADILSVDGGELDEVNRTV